MPSPTSITKVDIMRRPARGTKGFPSHTNTGPPKKATVAVVREKTLMALTAPFNGATYTTSISAAELDDCRLETADRTHFVCLGWLVQVVVNESLTTCQQEVTWFLGEGAGWRELDTSRDLARRVNG